MSSGDYIDFPSSVKNVVLVKESGIGCRCFNNFGYGCARTGDRRSHPVAEKKLEESADRIETVRGIGYRFCEN
jgi:hypothetical protein